jgi:hypothetical protein
LKVEGCKLQVQKRGRPAPFNLQSVTNKKPATVETVTG